MTCSILLAVGHDVDDALDGVGHLGAERLDGDRLRTDLVGPDAELHGRHFVGLETETANEAVRVEQLEPGFVLQLDFDRLRRLEVVVDRDGES